MPCKEKNSSCLRCVLDGALRKEVEEQERIGKPSGAAKVQDLSVKGIKMNCSHPVHAIGRWCDVTVTLTL